ncbi:MAG: response regulator transcription factor [Lachnospiraceae bacterium]|nr:response regulator transcription factor [Lachnospiraceae bacterium]MBR6476623.1 response regulator transcription factor [Lachnospiraceae bacterium]
MRIAVCDDEERFLTDIKDHIYEIYNSMDVVVDCFTSGKNLINSFDKQSYDLVFLDIEMPEIDGLTLAKMLREKSNELNIVFLTGHIEYALEGYEVNALRYLTKPVKKDKMLEVLHYVSEKLTKNHKLKIRVDGEDTFIDVNDIVYFEAQNQYIMIYTKTGEYLVRYNISDYENELVKDGFFRTHRSYLVNLSKVKKIGKAEVIMEGDKEVPVSRNTVKALKEALYSYIEKAAF